MAQCPSCGRELVEGDKFCRGCGAPVAEQSGAGAPSPPPSADDQSIREIAEKRVKERMELLRHIGIYVVVNIFLVIIWALTGHGYPWFIWVLAGWGLGLAIHTITYFVGTRSETRREKMIQDEMHKMKHEQQE